MNRHRAKARNLLNVRQAITGWGFGPSDVSRVAASIATATDEHEAARNALRVLVFTEATRTWLIEHDPKALEQAMSALPEFAEVPKERLGRPTPPRS
jgi:hypothetical protein